MKEPPWLTGTAKLSKSGSTFVSYYILIMALVMIGLTNNVTGGSFLIMALAMIGLTNNVTGGSSPFG